VYPENSKGFYKAYLNATTRPHVYLLLDFPQDTNDLLSLPTKVFPAEHPPTFYVAVADDEQTDQIQLPRAPIAKIGTPEFT
jgi:hypothetical protein